MSSVRCYIIIPLRVGAVAAWACHGGGAAAARRPPKAAVRAAAAVPGRAAQRRGEACVHVCTYILYIYMSRVHITCNLHSDDALQFIYTWANTHNHKKAHTRYLYMGKYNHVRLSVRIHKHAPTHKRRTRMLINIYTCICMCVRAHVRYTYKHTQHGCMCTFATNPKS